MTLSPLRPTSEERERRLQEIRREAEKLQPSELHPRQVEPIQQPQASAETGYYGTPVLKRPQWTVEVPIYFFVGGAAGAAALIAAVGELATEDHALIRDARWLAAIGGVISPALLTADLGMPSRFLHMLRVFKVQSPMSVGSWTLVAFSSSSVGAAMLGELRRRRPLAGVPFLTSAAQITSALTGLVLATYTGVLIGATAIPVWNEHVAELPAHFAASGLATAVSLLELRGHESSALNALAIGAALFETAMGAAIEARATPGTEALRHGVSGQAMRGAGFLSGPLPLALRILGLLSKRNQQQFRRAAAVSSVLGSLLTRWAWVRAGTASAEDPRVPLQIEKHTP
ncbi:MAG TPA: NrfD/PsrC family molybdoenzyme membrane anchor subunit [Candidatus Sulfotelmatobacter sp.]|nr:NrfD/PsrC family molybdoenzyme membrane anchor subunit [Candidatus Sulfotelmatobacter sp.]